MENRFAYKKRVVECLTPDATVGWDLPSAPQEAVEWLYASQETLTLRTSSTRDPLIV